MATSAASTPPRSPGSPGPHGPATPAVDPLAGATILTHGAPAAAAPDRPGQEGSRGLGGEWQRLRLFGGGLLLALCFGLFGWQAWRGRDPAPVTVQPLAPGSAAEIKVQVAGAVVSPGVYRLAQGDRVEDAIHAAGGFASDADTARLNLAQRVRDEQRLDVPFRRPAADGAGRPATDAGAGASLAAPGVPPETESASAAATARPPNAASPATSTPRATATARPAATVRPGSTPRATATARPQRPSPTPEPTARPDGKLDVNTATAAQLERLPGIGEVSAQRIIAYREANGRLTSLEDLRKAGLTESVLRRAADHLAFD